MNRAQNFAIALSAQLALRLGIEWLAGHNLGEGIGDLWFSALFAIPLSVWYATQENPDTRRNILVYATTIQLVIGVVDEAWAGRDLTVESVTRLIVFALPLAGIYAISASGLVVVYTTTGIFNFAQGAMGMFLAFVYWELRVNRDLPTWIALPLVVLILAPMLGVGLDRLIMRHLQGRPLVVQLMVTVGLMLGFLGLSATIWPQNTGRSMPELFGTDGFEIADVTVTWHRLTTLVTALVLAVVLRYLLFHTRTGVAMRAVVDNRSLAGLNGARPEVLSGTAWALGTSMAALAGILIAPENFAAEVLTLIILNAFAAAIIGRLRSLPLTYLGALILALAVVFSRTFLSLGQRWGQAPLAIPTIVLFIALLLLPQAGLRFARINAKRPRERVSTVRDAVIGAVALFVVMFVVSDFLSATNTNRMITGMVTGLIAISLVPLTGWAGQVNLAPVTFAAFGAIAYVKWGGDEGMWWAPLLAAAFAAPIGVLTALPAARLQGLYLALASMAFASMAQYVIFSQPTLLSTSSSSAQRLDVFGYSFHEGRPFLMLCTGVLGMMMIFVVTLRRSAFGRRLVALRDSEAASATVGVNVFLTKVIVFTLSAAMAGFAGAFFAQARGTISAQDAEFTMLAGIPVVLTLVVGGVAFAAGALFAGIFTVLLAIIVATYDISWLAALTTLAPGLAALGIISNPGGAVGEIGRAFAPLLPWRKDAREIQAAEKAADAEPEVGELGITRPFTREDIIYVEKQLGVVDDLIPNGRGATLAFAPD
ncbi:MAG: ABC transporter permease [Actinomycetota bacterium]|nr:ABC transporter permease [Actinomycetota bacterium]